MQKRIRFIPDLLFLRVIGGGSPIPSRADMFFLRWNLRRVIGGGSPIPSRVILF